MSDGQKTPNKSAYETTALENAERVKQAIENATKEKHRRLEERLAKKKKQLAQEVKRKEDSAAAAQAEIQKREKVREETAAKEASDAKRTDALAAEEEKAAYEQITAAKERKNRIVEEKHRKLKERLALKKQEQAQQAQHRIEEQKLAMERATAERLKQERLAVELHNSRLAAAGAKFKALENSYKEKKRRKLDQEAQEAEAARVAERIAHEEHLLELSKMRKAAEAEEILQKQRLLELTKSLEQVETQMDVSHEEVVEALRTTHLDEVHALKKRLLPEHLIPLKKQHRITLAQLKEEMLPEHVYKEREERVKLKHAKDIQLLKDKLLPEHPQVLAMQQKHEEEIADIQFVEALAEDEDQKSALNAKLLPEHPDIESLEQKQRIEREALIAKMLPVHVHTEMEEKLSQTHLNEIQALKAKLLPENTDIESLEQKQRIEREALIAKMLPVHVHTEMEEKLSQTHLNEIQALKAKLLPENTDIESLEQKHRIEREALIAKMLPVHVHTEMEEKLSQTHLNEIQALKAKLLPEHAYLVTLEKKKTAEIIKLKNMLMSFETQTTMLEDKNTDGAKPTVLKTTTPAVIIIPDDALPPSDGVRYVTDNTCSSIDGSSITTDANFEVDKHPEDEPSDLDIALALMRGDEYQPKQKPDPHVVDQLRPTDNDLRLQDIEKRMEEDRKCMEALEKSMDQIDNMKATSQFHRWPGMTEEDEGMLRMAAACFIQCVWRGTQFRRANKYMMIGIKRLTMRTMRLKNIKQRQTEEIEAQRREFKGLELVVAREQKACRRLEHIAFRKSIHESVTSPSREPVGKHPPIPFTVQSQHTARKKAELSVQEAHGKIRRMSHKITQLLKRLNMSKAEHKAEAEKEISKMRNEMIHHSKRSDSEISRLGAIVETMGRDPDLNPTLHRTKLPPKTSAVQTDEMTDTFDLGSPLARGLRKHKGVLLPTIREQITPTLSAQRSKPSMRSGDQGSERGKQIRVLTFDAPSTLSSPPASTRVGTFSPASSSDLKPHQTSHHRAQKGLTAAGLGVYYEPGTISAQDLRKMYL